MPTCLEKSWSFSFMCVSFVNVLFFLICMCASFSSGLEDLMWDLIVIDPYHCLFFVFLYFVRN